MQKKITVILIATVAGIGLGALLGYGPLLRYKSEGVLHMDMATGEYKRFSELANDAATIAQFLAVSPPPKMTQDGSELLMKTVTRTEWHKPLPKISKADTKELPDVVLQMERDTAKDKEKEKEQGTTQEKPVKAALDNPVYVGVRLTILASDPTDAAAATTWLGTYFKDVATREAVREQVSQWTAESRQFSDRAQELKLKYEFDIEQAKNRAIALKKIVAQYPASATHESHQVVNVLKDNEKFMSPMAQLVGAESEMIGVKEKIQKLNRNMEQQAFVAVLIGDADAALRQVHSGSESVAKLTAVMAELGKKVKTDAEREKLLSLAADISHITARFQSKAQFIAPPSTPTRPERPTPLMYMALLGALGALLAAAYCWRKDWVNLLRSESNNSIA